MKHGWAGSHPDHWPPLLDPYVDPAPGCVQGAGPNDQGLTQNGRCALPANPILATIQSLVTQKGIVPSNLILFQPPFFKAE